MRLRLLESMCDQIDLNFISDAGSMRWPVIALKEAKETGQMQAFTSGWRVTPSSFRGKAITEKPD